MHEISTLEKIINLYTISKEVGLSEDEQFICEIEDLCTRKIWDEYRYQNLFKRCIEAQGFPSLVDRTFRVPAGKRELEIIKGDFEIGHVIGSDVPIGLKKSSLRKSLLLAGAMGTGKTNGLNIIINELLRDDNINIWCIDPKTMQQEFRWTLKKHPETIILPLSQLKLSPFSPIPGVPRKALMESAIDVLGDAFGVLDASQGVLAEHTEKMFKQHEIPTYFDVMNSILKEKSQRYGKRQQYIDTLEVRLKSAKMSLGDVFNCQEDFFPCLYGRSVIFEIGGISNFAKRVLAPLIIMKLLLFKTYNPSKNNELNVLAFEEAQNAVFAKFIEDKSRTSTVAQLAVESRAYGLSVILLSQNPSTKIITEMHSNSATIICFHVGGSEVPGLQRSMGLSIEQADMLQRLDVGEAVMKSNFGYFEPIHIKLNLIDIIAPGNDEVYQKMKPVWEELNKNVTPIKENSDNPSSDNDENSKKELKKTNELELHPDDFILLRDIELRPYEFTEKRYKECTLARNRAGKVKERLLRGGYIQEVSMKLGSRGKPSKLLILTEKSYTYLNTDKPVSKSGLLHGFYQYFIFHIAKKHGLKAKIEDSGCDVSINNGKEYLAVEVTIHESNIEQNIDRNLKNGFSQVWLAVKDDKMYKKILSSDVLLMKPNVKVFLLSEIIPRIKELQDK